MRTLVHSLDLGSSKRSEAVEKIRRDTKLHLAEARIRLRLTAETHRARRSESLLSTRLAAALLLGQSAKMIEDFHSLRIAESVQLERQLASSAKKLRTQTHKWLAVLTHVRRKNAVTAQKVRLADKARLHKQVWDMKKRYTLLLGTLARDRVAAGGFWQTHAAGGSAQLAAPSIQAEKPHSPSLFVHQITAQMQASRRNAAPAEAKREVDGAPVAKPEAAAEATISHKGDTTTKLNPPTTL